MAVAAAVADAAAAGVATAALVIAATAVVFEERKVATDLVVKTEHKSGRISRVESEARPGQALTLSRALL